MSPVPGKNEATVSNEQPDQTKRKIDDAAVGNKGASSKRRTSRRIVRNLIKREETLLAQQKLPADANGIVTGSGIADKTRRSTRRSTRISLLSDQSKLANMSLSTTTAATSTTATIPGMEPGSYPNQLENSSSSLEIDEEAARLFAELKKNQASKSIFNDQSLVILLDSEKKASREINHDCLIKNEGVRIIKRNPHGQIYYVEDLQKHVHCSASSKQSDDLQELCKNVEVIETNANVFKEDFAVWNVDDEECPFLADTSKLIEKVFVGFQTAMKLPKKDDARGTIATNVGLTTTDCQQYSENRTTILETVKPFLTKLDPNIPEDAINALGDLAVYVAKKILPALGQEDHFKLPKTDAGHARNILRHKLASLLGVGGHQYEYFLTEAISIIIPIILLPHRDKLNDGTAKNQSGTVTLNCTLPISIITNKKILEIVKLLGYTTTFPCSIIFYGRGCCGNYLKFMEKLNDMEQGSKAEQAIVSCIRKTDVVDSRDYIGQLFNSSPCHYDTISAKLVEATPKMEVSFKYDIMSKWSIVFDMVLDIQFYLGQVNAGHVIQHLLHAVLPEPEFGISKTQELVEAKLRLRAEENADGAVLYNNLFEEIGANLRARVLSKTATETHTSIDPTVDGILAFCNSIGIHAPKAMKHTAVQIDDACCRFRELLVGGGFGRKEAVDFIQLMAIFGFIPIYYLMWFPHLGSNGPDIDELVQYSPCPKERKTMQLNLVGNMISNISPVTGSFLSNILATRGNATDNGNRNDARLAGHYYYFQRHRNSMQHFYRVKVPTPGKWLIEMLRDPKRLEKPNSKRTVVLADWRGAGGEKETFIYWKRKGGFIEKTSNLVIPVSLQREFFNFVTSPRSEVSEVKEQVQQRPSAPPVPRRSPRLKNEDSSKILAAVAVAVPSPVAAPALTPVAPVSAKKTKTARAQTPKKKSEKTPAPPAPTPTLAPTFSKSEPQMAVIVHRFRNANYIPRGILRLCSTPYSPNTNDCPQLAVSREGGAVELVSVNEKWKCVGMVEGMKNRSVDTMAWVCGEVAADESGNGDEFQLQLQDESDQKAKEEVYFNRQHQLAAQVQQKRRLFGASRDGTIFELDFKTKKHSGVIRSGGGAVFCLQSLCPCCSGTSASCGKLIAAGCEDGSVRIYKAAVAASSKDDSCKACLELISTLPSVGGAVISIAWLPGSGDNGMERSIIYAGAADGTIRKFQCTSALHMARQSGSAPHAISTGAVLNNDDDVEMAGDSRLSSLQWKAGLRMTVENRGRRSATKIWTLSVLKDGTVVSGDSMGNVQFWDGIAGTLLQSFEHNSNNGDVLDLAISYDQNKVMASGVDSRVICMERIPSTSCVESKWVLTNQQRSHTHDVNSLAMVYISDSSGSLGSKKKCRELLCSGGVDTKVCSYFVSNMKKYRAKIAYKYPTKAPIALSRGPRILSIMRQDKVDFFQLAQVETDVENASNTALNEEEAYLGSVGIASNYNLVAFDVSEDGKFLAVSHTAGLLLFALNFVEGASEEDGGNSTVLVPKKLNIPTDADVACSALKFGTDFLICATTSGPINLVRLETGSNGSSATLEHSFDQNSDEAFKCESHPITEVTLSADRRWFAVSRNALGKGSLQVFSLPKQQLWWTLPCTEAPHSCIKFLGEDRDVAPALAVACNNGVVYLFDVELKCFSDWSEDLGFPAEPNLPIELGSCSHCPETLAYNTATPNKFVMGGHSWFCSIDVSSPVPLRSKPFPHDHFKAKNWAKSYMQERRRSNSISEKSKSSDSFDLKEVEKDLKKDEANRNFTICLRYSDIIFQDFLDKNEMVVVEQPRSSIVDTLPHALERQRYGS